MTCIIGFIDKKNNNIYVGVDSAASNDDNFISDRGDRKVFKRGPFIFGFSHSFRMGQIIRYKFQIRPPGNLDLDTYFVGIFIDDLRECLKIHGFTKIESNVEDGGNIIVGYKDKNRIGLYTIYSDFQICRYKHNFHSIGSGYKQAFASLYSTEGLLGRTRKVLTPSQRIRIALKSAEQFDSTVRRPFIIRKL